MYAVGKLGSYISRGVVTFSAPFHPFGGAVDIVVVQQEDGSFKTSPWYVQFGKFQGVLKAREKVVSISVNGVDADFRMYLDSKGGAYFLREVEGEEEVSESVSSSGDDTDGELQRIVSCKYDLQGLKPVSGGNGKVTARSISTGPRILGLTSKHGLKEGDDLWKQENGVRGDREVSLERAEIAADLLEVMWSTSLATSKQLSDTDLSKFEQRSRSDTSIVPQCNGEVDVGSPPPTVTYLESFTIEEMYLGVNFVSESSVGSNEFDARIVQNHVGEMSSGDESRMERLQSSIYSEASESFGKELDGLSGESSESLSFNCPNAATTSRVKTEKEAFLECETNEAHGEYAEEMMMDQFSSVQESGSTNSILMEELTNPKIGSTENLGSKEPCNHTSTNLLHLGSHENDGSPAVGTNECSGDAFQLKMKNDDVSKHLESEKLPCSNLDCSESHRIESPSFTSPGSVVSESNFQDLGEGSEDKVGGLPEKLNEEQFSFSDLDGPEPPKTIDPLLDSPETENDPKHHSGNSKENFGESTAMLGDMHSFTGRPTRENLPHDKPTAPEMSRTTSSPIDIAKTNEWVGQVGYTVGSLPSLLSSGAEMNAQSFDHSISHSFDSSIDSMRLSRVDIPSTVKIDVLEQQSTSRQTSREHSQTLEELKNILSDPAVEISLCRHLLFDGMGYEAASHAFDAEKLDMEKLVSLGPDIIKNDRLVVRIGGLYFPWDSALPIISAIGSPGGGQILEPKGMITVDQVDKTTEGNPQQLVVSRKGTWALWPFRKTKSLNRNPSNVTKVTDDRGGTVRNADTPESKNAKKKFVRVNTPTSQQLATLNLKEGRNEVTFTFSTPMLGEQKVDARMFLWKWNACIVISDVDGTITKSDVLGQFMPMVGVDWSQTGVTHLFSAIKWSHEQLLYLGFVSNGNSLSAIRGENGYELLFLSARAISQASLTRQFLINLKQDGKALPEGPVVISPDGLFPSLFREVIRRAPHEFKIACLEDIKALFPPDHNPFYAGFGNRLTDEISYLQVGIPKGKIFTINPKGEVAVQRRIDTKSYTSLHTLVHDMFPPVSCVSSSEQEIFNSWQFWKLPPSHNLV